NNFSYGGGMFCLGSTTLINSTIAENASDGKTFGGGLAIFSSANGVTSITNSTISGNTSYAAGGMLLRSETIIRNSTIAFNSSSGNGYAAGISIKPFGPPITVILESTLVANNLQNGLESDLGVQDPNNSVAFSGSSNLVVSSPVMLLLPGDTITDAPLLG